MKEVGEAGIAPSSPSPPLPVLKGRMAGKEQRTGRKIGERGGCQCHPMPIYLGVKTQ